jgi:hypothetical protein
MTQKVLLCEILQNLVGDDPDKEILPQQR